MNAKVETAYSLCRGTTRSAARNFYYAFHLLPRAKGDALCAVYAFMRQADDIADDPQLPCEQKRERLQSWSDAMNAAMNGSPTDDPVLVALSDAGKRFALPAGLLEALVRGTSVDADPAPDGGLRIFHRTFDDLYRYCYGVASVVGLLTIRIFGYSDPAAEKLAERCGVAFQLTNILRDVREDAAMGRLYLPAEDLASFGIEPLEFCGSEGRNGFQPARFRPLLEMEAQRARELYRAGDQLVPFIDRDCQAALWVLVEIYRRLLAKIAASNYDVFQRKVRLSVPEKLAVLLRGTVLRLKHA